MSDFINRTDVINMISRIEAFGTICRTTNSVIKAICDMPTANSGDLVERHRVISVIAGFDENGFIKQTTAMTIKALCDISTGEACTSKKEESIELVRCQKCRYYVDMGTGRGYCNDLNEFQVRRPNDFCSRAKKKEE